MIQGSSEWLAFRRTKITSSDAAVIMGINPWVSPYELWQSKLELIPEQEENEAMRKGSELEPIARDLFMKSYGIIVEPAVLVHPKLSWMAASFDGISKDNQIVEIKCSKKYLEMALSEKIEPYIMAQLQHLIEVAQVNEIFLFCYWDEQYKLLTIQRDQAFIDKLIKEEEKFYRCLQELEAPSLTEADKKKMYTRTESWLWSDTASKLFEVKKQIKELKEQEEALTTALIGQCQNQNMTNGKLKFTKCLRRAAIEYSKIEVLKQIDLEQYRKKPIVYWKLGEE